MDKQKLSIFWFRRDLRLDDNHGLCYALKDNAAVLPVFIFDTNILQKLENKSDRRVDFIHQVIENLNKTLQIHGSSLEVINDTPLNAFTQLLKRFEVTAVYTNCDYEPYASAR